MDNKERDKLLQKMRAGSFRENNGRVLRTVNILRDKFVQLRIIGHALPEIDEGELIDSLNFLKLEGYIELRNTDTHEAVQRMADARYTELEAALTGKGIRLLSGSIQDNDVIV